MHGRAPRRRHGADQHLTADAGVEDLLRELALRVLGVLVRRYRGRQHSTLRAVERWSPKLDRLCRSDAAYRGSVARVKVKVWT